MIPNTPKDGDFASYLEGNRASTSPADLPEANAKPLKDFEVPVAQPRQTLQQVLIEGEAPTEEFLEEWNALENAPELSDEELARQALSAAGEDGDTQTPE